MTQRPSGLWSWLSLIKTWSQRHGLSQSLGNTCSEWPAREGPSSPTASGTTPGIRQSPVGDLTNAQSHCEDARTRTLSAHSQGHVCVTLSTFSCAEFAPSGPRSEHTLVSGGRHSRALSGQHGESQDHPLRSPGFTLLLARAQARNGSGSRGLGS